MVRGKRGKRVEKAGAQNRSQGPDVGGGVPRFETESMRSTRNRGWHQRELDRLAERYARVDRSDFRYRLHQSFLHLRLFDPKNRPVAVRVLEARLLKEPDWGRLYLSKRNPRYAFEKLKSVLKKKWMGRMVDPLEEPLLGWVSNAFSNLDARERSLVEEELLSKIAEFRADPVLLKAIAQGHLKRAKK